MSQHYSLGSVIKLSAVMVVSGLAIGLIVPSRAKASAPKPATYSLAIKDAVIDFGQNADRVTIKCALDNVANSTDVNHFRVQVIIQDMRDGSQHDTGPQVPTVVR